jgi:uncharacterized protein with PIN domain
MASKRGAVAVAQRRHTRQLAAQAQFQEVFLGLQEWRALHPQAQFAAIEAELDRRLNQQRAQLLADLALASAATEVTPVACCPGCGGALRDEGPRQRTVVTVGQAPVTLDRDYATCTQCGYRFFPSGR